MPRFCSIFSQLLQLFPRTEFQKAVDGDEGGAPCAGVHVLGPICRHAVLPAGPGALLARDLWRPGELRGQARASGHRRRRRARRWPTRTPIARGRCRAGVLSVLGAVSGGRRREEVSLQEQAGEAGHDGDRPVRGDVPMGDVPPQERRGEVAFHPRSRGLSAHGGGDHRRETT